MNDSRWRNFPFNHSLWWDWLWFKKPDIDTRISKPGCYNRVNYFDTCAACQSLLSGDFGIHRRGSFCHRATEGREQVVELVERAGPLRLHFVLVPRDEAID